MGGSMAWKREEEKQYKRKNFERRFILQKNQKRVILSKNQKNMEGTPGFTPGTFCVTIGNSGSGMQISSIYKLGRNSFWARVLDEIFQRDILGLL